MEQPDLLLTGRLEVTDTLNEPLVNWALMARQQAISPQSILC